MAIFFNENVRELLESKKLIVIGDSIQRSVYKDLICLWTQQDSRYLSEQELRAKGELSFLGDKLLQGGKLEGKMVNGVDYREVRQFSDGKVSFKYYFVTRSYSEHMMSILNELKTFQPDVIVMNSTFWDLHHYGDSDMSQYRENLATLLDQIKEAFPPRMLFIWNAALPLAERCKGGFLRKGFLTIPIDKIKTANKFAWMATSSQNKVYLDLFTELKDKDTFQQAEDGIHWGMRAHRKISNLILTEICKAWNWKIPDLPIHVAKHSNNRKPTALTWSSYYPVIDSWSGSPSSLSYEDYELDYYVPPAYWGMPSTTYDRYLTPSPLLPSPYSNGRARVSLNYNHPFTSSVLDRAREYQPFASPAPYMFPTRYLPIESVDLNFATPQAYFPGKTLFKPVVEVDPMHFSYHLRSGIAQGLLPTPLARSSVSYFNEGDRYRNRFKKLSNLRAQRNKSSTPSTSTPLTSNATQSKQSATISPQNSVTKQNPEDLSKETTQKLPSDQGSEVLNEGISEIQSPENPCNNKNCEISATEIADHNNNKEEIESMNESCPRADVEENVEVEGASDQKRKLSTQTQVLTSDNLVQNEGLSNGGSEGAGLKRKREVEDCGESNFSKIARKENSDDHQGMKRKHPEDEVEDEHLQKCARSDGNHLVGKDASAIQSTQVSPLKDAEESVAEENVAKEIQAEIPNFPDIPQDNRCSLSYDSFI